MKGNIMSKEIAAKQNTAVALAGQFEEDAGSGFENADSNAYAIPFLSILQAVSAQCKKSEGAYIPGAEEGMLFDSVTKELINGTEGVIIVPCYFKRSYIQWTPSREFRGEYTVSVAEGGGVPGTVKLKGRILCGVPQGATDLFDAKGNPLYDELSDTRTHYVLRVYPDGSYKPFVISMSRSQIKRSRNWMSRMDGIRVTGSSGKPIRPPMYSHMYHLTSFVEKKDGDTWMGWQTALLKPVDDMELYQAAKAFRDAVSSGEVKEAMPHAEVDRTGENADADGAF